MKITFSEFPELSNFSLVAGEDVGRGYEIHLHDRLCVGAVTHGSRLMRFGRQVEIINRGELFSVNPGQPHSVECPDGKHGYVVLTAPTKYAAGITIKNKILDNELFGDLIELEYCSRAGNAEVVRVLTVKIITELIDRHAVAARKVEINEVYRERINAVKALIDGAPLETYSLGRLAAAACMSPFHFSRVFAAVVGMPPHKYVLMKKIKACERMIADGRSISDVFFNAGLADQSHLTRRFAAYTGLPPSRYRNSRRIVK